MAKQESSGAPNSDDLITQTEAAQLRDVSVAAISALVQRGRLRCVERFGKMLVYRSEVLAFEREKPGRKRHS